MLTFSMLCSLLECLARAQLDSLMPVCKIPPVKDANLHADCPPALFILICFAGKGLRGGAHLEALSRAWCIPFPPQFTFTSSLCGSTLLPACQSDPAGAALNSGMQTSGPKFLLLWIVKWVSGRWINLQKGIKMKHQNFKQDKCIIFVLYN